MRWNCREPQSFLQFKLYQSMHLALIFPPSVPPTSPPCGISYLKAFLGTGRTFDLNLAYHETAVRMLNQGSLSVEAEIAGYVLEPEHLEEAVQFLRGGNNFFDRKDYNTHVLIFLSYFNKIHSYIKEECMKYLFKDSADDEALNFLDQLLEPIKRYHTDLVGFSQMIFSQRDFILGLAARLKADDIPLLIGGASLSQNPEVYLSEIGVRKEVDLSEFFDAAFYGEGELPLKAYLDEEKLENIPNIVYKNEKIIKNKASGLESLDVLPAPDFRDFSLKDYYAPEIVLPVLTSRGCYWMRCTFCIHYKSYYKYRTRSVGNVISDLKLLQKEYGASYFLFADEMVHPEKISQLSDSILEEDLQIRYYSEAKPTNDFTKELLKKMYDSGARALLWGVESGTQRILDVIDKGTTIPDIEDVLKNSHEAGIWNMIFMIVGYPTQTKQEVKEDIAFLQRNEQYVSTVARSLFQLEVNSRIYEHPEQFGIEKVEKNPNPFSTVCRYTISKGIPREEASQIYKNNTRTLLKLFKISQHFGKLRDHMLLFADHVSGNPLR
jgi:anaerobic magnesium-protoporphyrin IX monomethyl ester cyclase